jgi:hypothetical protein
MQKLNKKMLPKLLASFMSMLMIFSLFPATLLANPDRELYLQQFEQEQAGFFDYDPAMAIAEFEQTVADFDPYSSTFRLDTAQARAQAVLENFAIPQGVLGFYGPYAINYPNEIVEIFVEFLIPGSIALSHAHQLGIETPFGRMSGTFEEQAISAHYMFRMQLYRIGISTDTIFWSAHNLVNGVWMRVPAHTLEAIAALDTVAAVTPNFRLDEPEYIVHDVVEYSSSASLANDFSWEHPYNFMRGPRNLYNTDYIHGEMGFTGAGIRVGVIDSGLRHDHMIFAHLDHMFYNEDLGVYQFPGWNGVTMDYDTWEGSNLPGGIPNLASNHGTHVAASMIAIAPEAELWVYALSRPGHPDSFSWSTVQRTVERAWEDGMDVINASWGMNLRNAHNANWGEGMEAPFARYYVRDPWSATYGPLHRAINNITLDGILWVQAAGNDAGGIMELNYDWIGSPSNVSLSLGVGGQTLGTQTAATVISSVDNVHASSSRGLAHFTGHSRVDTLASFNVHIGTTTGPTAFGNTQGTSFSAPQGAGLAALMLQQTPDMEPLELRARIMNTSIRPTQLTVAQASSIATGGGRMSPIDALNSTAWAVAYQTAPYGLFDGQRLWIEEPQQMGSLSFGFFTDSLNGPVIPIRIYDSPSDAGWSLSYEIYTSSRLNVNITDLTGMEFVVDAHGDGLGFDVQMNFVLEPTFENLHRRFTGFIYLTYNGYDDIVIPMPWSGSLEFMEPYFSQLTANRDTMNVLGGDWIINATGFFVGDLDFVVYADDQIWLEGMFIGSQTNKTANINIPRNYTGYDILFTLHVPGLENEYGYAPLTLLQEGIDPGFSHVTIINNTIGTAANHWHWLALDSTLTAYDKFMGGESVSVIDDFDTWVPGFENPTWTNNRVNMIGSASILAGIYDVFWWAWAPAIQVPIFTNAMEFTADTNYFIILDQQVLPGQPQGSGIYRILANPETTVGNISHNRNNGIGVLGGPWAVNADGFFYGLTEGVEFTVYVDGEIFQSGTMDAGPRSPVLNRNASIIIPENTTGSDRIFTFVISGFEHEEIAMVQDGQHPGFAYITVINHAQMTNHFNILGFDSTLTAMDKFPTLNIVDDFDQYVPNVSLGGNWADYRFLDYGSGQVLAGTYDMVWWRNAGLGVGGTVVYLEQHHFTAGNHYIVELVHWETGHRNPNNVINVFAIDEPFLREANFSRTSFNMLGGDVHIQMTGYFIGDIPFVVTHNGELVSSGYLTGQFPTVKTGVANIPKNETGYDQIFEITIPQFGVIQEILVSGDEINFARVTFAIGRPWNQAANSFVMLLSSNNNTPDNNFATYDISLPGNFLDNPVIGNGLQSWSYYTILVPEGIYSIHTGEFFGAAPWTFSLARAMDFEFAAGYHYIFSRGTGHTATGWQPGIDWGAHGTPLHGNSATGMNLHVIPIHEIFYGVTEQEGTSHNGGGIIATPTPGHRQIGPADPVAVGHVTPVPQAISASQGYMLVDRGTDVVLEGVPMPGWRVHRWSLDFLMPTMGDLSNQPSLPTFTLRNINWNQRVMVEFYNYDPTRLDSIEIYPVAEGIVRGQNLQLEYILTDQFGRQYHYCPEYVVNYDVVWSLTEPVEGVAVDQNGLVTVGRFVPINTEFVVRAAVLDTYFYAEITVTVLPVMIEVQFEAIGGGVVTAEVNGYEIQSGDLLLEGSDIRFYAFADTGWNFIGWDFAPLIEELSADGEFALYNVMLDIIVTATFAETPLELTYIYLGENIYAPRYSSFVLTYAALDQFGRDYHGDYTLIWSLPNAPNGVNVNTYGDVVIGRNVPVGTEFLVRASVTNSEVYGEITVTVTPAMLAVVFNTEGYGAVIATVDGIAIQSGDKVQEGKNITFTAIAGNGWQFVGWEQAPVFGPFHTPSPHHILEVQNLQVGISLLALFEMQPTVDIGITIIAPNTPVRERPDATPDPDIPSLDAYVPTLSIEPPASTPPSR